MSSSINNVQLRSFQCHAIAELTTNMRHHNPKKHRKYFHAKSAPSQRLSCQICTITELTTNVEESRSSQVIASARLTTRHSYTRTVSQKDTLTHRHFYAQTLLPTDTCIHGHIYRHTHTHPLTHKPFYTETLLHTDTGTHRQTYTQTLLHRDPFTHGTQSQFETHTV